MARLTVHVSGCTMCSLHCTCTCTYTAPVLMPRGVSKPRDCYRAPCAPLQVHIHVYTCVCNTLCMYRPWLVGLFCLLVGLLCLRPETEVSRGLRLINSKPAWRGVCQLQTSSDRGRGPYIGVIDLQAYVKL